MSSSAAARIPAVLDLDDDQRALLAQALPTPDATPPNVMATLVRHPVLMRRINALGGVFLVHGRLPPRERELAILRVAWRVGSLYEYGQHVVLGQRAGLTEDELAQVCGGKLTGWSAADDELLRFVDQVLTRARVPDELWLALNERFSPEQLLEFTALVGFYAMMAGIIDVAGIPLDEGYVAEWPTAVRS